MKKNDYTLGGKLSSTTWTEFVAFCKEHGIKTNGKKFVDLALEVEAMEDAKKALAEAEAAQAGVSIPTKDKFVVSKSMGEAIVRRILVGGKDRNGKTHAPAVFVASKSKDPETNGKAIVTMSKLFAIIGDVYGLDKAAPGSNDIIKDVVNYLCKAQWLRFKRYEGGGIIFFPTKKMRDYQF